MLPAMNKKVFFFLITVVSLFATSANGAPMAYSVNSDGQNLDTFDSLYLIDLALSGSEQRRGSLYSGLHNFFDTEGLAFSPDGTLWGVDDDSRILFPINTSTATINFLEVIPLPSFPSSGGNDFGMTFTCDNTLYVTSVVTRTLYHIDEQGNSSVVGGVGALGANISAIAANGNPTRLYGLGNGLLDTGATDSPNLYSIDTETGVATLIGTGLGNVEPYHEAGLAFDADGNLWAITDRSGLNNQPSQVLSIDVSTGLATPVSTTSETGFESLAIAPPANCEFLIGRGYDDPYDRIPTLGPIGLLLTTLALALVGMITLRRRVF